jgi:hypothetical protein
LFSRHLGCHDVSCRWFVLALAYYGLGRSLGGRSTGGAGRRVVGRPRWRRPLRQVQGLHGAALRLAAAQAPLLEGPHSLRCQAAPPLLCLRSPRDECSVRRTGGLTPLCLPQVLEEDRVDGDTPLKSELTDPTSHSESLYQLVRRIGQLAVVSRRPIVPEDVLVFKSLGELTAGKGCRYY